MGRTHRIEQETHVDDLDVDAGDVQNTDRETGVAVDTSGSPVSSSACEEMSLNSRQTPHKEHIRSDRGIVVLLLRLGIDGFYFLWLLRCQDVARVIVCIVDVLRLGWDRNIDLVLVPRASDDTQVR